MSKSDDKKHQRRKLLKGYKCHVFNHVLYERFQMNGRWEDLGQTVIFNVFLGKMEELILCHIYRKKIESRHVNI